MAFTAPVIDPSLTEPIIPASYTDAAQANPSASYPDFTLSPVRSSATPYFSDPANSNFYENSPASTISYEESPSSTGATFYGNSTSPAGATSHGQFADPAAANAFENFSELATATFYEDLTRSSEPNWSQEFTEAIANAPYALSHLDAPADSGSLPIVPRLRPVSALTGDADNA